jgi:5'-nucleotidase
MRILVTNDDGLDSVGLHELARAMTDLGEVVVAAPDREYSGAGAALGALHLLQPEVHRRQIPGIDDVWAVNGPPGLCVMFARLGVFGDRFDLVVSGINPGANVGRSIYHSGTVGACLTGRNGGVSGVAVSQAVTGFGVEGQGWGDVVANQRWGSAAEIARGFVAGMLKELPSAPVVVNLNVPNLPIEEIAGWRHGEIGTFPPRTMTSANLVPIAGQIDSFTIDMDWGDPIELPEHTDGGLVERDYVSVSYLSRIEHEPRQDLGGAEDELERVLQG